MQQKGVKRVAQVTRVIPCGAFREQENITSNFQKEEENTEHRKTFWLGQTRPTSPKAQWWIFSFAKCLFPSDRLW